MEWVARWKTDSALRLTQWDVLLAWVANLLFILANLLGSPSSLLFSVAGMLERVARRIIWIHTRFVCRFLSIFYFFNTKSQRIKNIKPRLSCLFSSMCLLATSSIHFYNTLFIFKEKLMAKNVRLQYIIIEGIQTF